MARQSHQQRAEARRQSLMQQYNLGADLDPKTKELADKLYNPAPGGYRGSKRLGGEQDQRKAYQKNVSFIQQYSVPETMFAEAAAAGVDPRTIESLKKQSDKAKADALEIRRKSRSPGIVGAVYSSRLRNLDRTVGSIARQLQGELKADVAIQPELQEIRRKREEATEKTVSAMTRKRGKASLLSGATGGVGFLGGYFR
jgi:hypothetical protein